MSRKGTNICSTKVTKILSNNLYCELSVLCNAISTKYWAKFRIAGTSRKGNKAEIRPETDSKHQIKINSHNMLH